MYFIFKQNNDNLPYLVTISGHKILALVYTILDSSEFSQKCNIPISYENCLNITTADGVFQNILGYVYVNETTAEPVKKLFAWK